MSKWKYFNVTLTRDMIAQAYRDNESHNALCFLVGPPSNNLPTGFTIYDVKIVNGELQIQYENKTPYAVDFYVNNGMLFCKFTEGGETMALVNLGNVIGPPGPQGATGPEGPQGPTGPEGAQGPAGNDGISPTFFIGDGTGGTVNGHLYADYDNPYTP